ncbi:MAG: type II and III secretion system protein family protein [Pseudomonadota bacterium]|nr:type II and III secretion system protein family protein [Pseudomonadota bacterium]
MRPAGWQRLLVKLVAAAFVATGALLPLSAGEARAAERVLQIGQAKRTATIKVIIGKTEDVRTDASFVDVVVGDPEVADVNPLTDRSLSILGRKSGTTRVSIYAEGKKLIGVFDVEVTVDTAVLSSTLAQRFPYAKIKVSAVNGRLMLTGTSPDAVTLDGAVQVARQFGSEIINSVEVLAPQQVMLEVRFIEANRQAGRELGVQWNAFSKNGRFLANIGDRKDASQLPVTQAASTAAGAAAGVISGAPPFGFMIGRLLAGGLTADVLINALEEKGMARNLAEPNLVALSGDTASFLAGGEFPIPVPGQLGQISIEYKRYGVGLAFTPTVLGGGLINLKIEPEVSQLDPSNAITVGPVQVPALIVRRASTTIELRDGQSFVIGGLLQNQGQTTQEQLPWIGDVPVLGALFRSASYQKKETDLAIIVTPRLVRPTRPGDLIATPLDNSLPPNDADLFLMGKPEISPAMAKLAGGVDRPFSGHMLDMPKSGIVVEFPKEGGHVLSVKN